MLNRCRIVNLRHKGFTLVELSIVLVIIGLIIGGVLTGQQIIQNARITNALNAIQAYEAQFQTYTQNYGALPGDDPNAVQRFATLVPATPGNGDGVLEGTFDSINATDETRLVWADLRAADLVKSQGGTSTAETAQPPNPFGGIYGFQNGAFGGAFTTTVLCLNDVPGTAATAIDSRLDDGLPNSGNVLAMVATGAVGEAVGGTVATSYVSTQTYTMCIKM